MNKEQSCDYIPCGEEIFFQSNRTNECDYKLRTNLQIYFPLIFSFIESKYPIQRTWWIYIVYDLTKCTDLKVRFTTTAIWESNINHTKVYQEIWNYLVHEKQKNPLIENFWLL